MELLLVFLEGGRIGRLLGHDPRQGIAPSHLRAAGRRQEASREDGAQLHELVRRYVHGPEQRPVGLADDVAPDGDGVAPHAPRGPARRPGQGQLGGQLLQGLVPLVAPDVEVDVDDVVEGHGEVAQPVADRERARLRERLEVPDDPVAAGDRRLAIGVRRSARAELRRGPGGVAGGALGHRDVTDLLAVSERDVAVGAGERAVEEERGPLLDRQRAVRLDRDVDVGRGQVEGLRSRLAGCEEREQDRRRKDGSPQNSTRGASRAAASSTSKYSRGSKLKTPATMFVGTVSSALS